MRARTTKAVAAAAAAAAAMAAATTTVAPYQTVIITWPDLLAQAVEVEAILDPFLGHLAEKLVTQP